MITLRPAAVDDVEQLFAMLHASACEQGFPDDLAVTVDDLRKDGFGPDPHFQAVIAEWNGVSAGMALYFFTYSTWVSRLGLYLEDLYINPDHRRKGVGRALLQHLAQIAREHRCRRFQWVVHRGNSNAIALYESFGARTLDHWALMSIKGDALDAL
jgi:GNAT superfamily N-acetyltransferase